MIPTLFRAGPTARTRDRPTGLRVFPIDPRAESGQAARPTARRRDARHEIEDEGDRPISALRPARAAEPVTLRQRETHPRTQGGARARDPWRRVETGGAP